jgi:hypothetical protein
MEALDEGFGVAMWGLRKKTAGTPCSSVFMGLHAPACKHYSTTLSLFSFESMPCIYLYKSRPEAAFVVQGSSDVYSPEAALTGAGALW